MTTIGRFFLFLALQLTPDPLMKNKVRRFSLPEYGTSSQKKFGMYFTLPNIKADLCRDLVLLRHPGDSFAIRLVVLPTGRIARQLFVGLHVAELFQLTLLRLPARSRIRRARHRFNFLLLRHLPVHHAVIQGDDAIDLVQ